MLLLHSRMSFFLSVFEKKPVSYHNNAGYYSYVRIKITLSSMYWVIQNDCGQVWQLCTKIHVATVWVG
jgi:hypothetical protein